SRHLHSLVGRVSLRAGREQAALYRPGPASWPRVTAASTVGVGDDRVHVASGCSATGAVPGTGRGPPRGRLRAQTQPIGARSADCLHARGGAPRIDRKIAIACEARTDRVDIARLG